ncbi:ATP-binding cassette sub-family G member 1 isoform X1 [Amyelois transitella]|uniref:ATP-binding cassette sub-family G member 1 isoform X1 n=2 Tax=Amyelois transitella TaxID=680683 RepID=UPI00298F6A32|nr:ATP-binding cassette sub-family G member 1 isoform X1 [Amyelois transitella]
MTLSQSKTSVHNDYSYDALENGKTKSFNKSTVAANNSEYGDFKKTFTHLPKRLPVDIEFSDLSYSVYGGRKKGYKDLLKSINGSFRSGELTAIMGPSGAGKSTLMNIVAGYKTSDVSGSILINGSERNQRTFRKLSCYIMQDDCLLPQLTVQEAMDVSASLKLGKNVSNSAKDTVIQEILDLLNLADNRNTRTINLSGGQRKRLSIALELVNNPPVMFFDEPTSGLDSSSCYQCISLLKLLAKGGRTVICTIHQPSARLFEMFDYLYTLAEGQCIYQGKVNELVPFLSSVGLDCPSSHNPANYIIEVASGEYGNVWAQRLATVTEQKSGRDKTEKHLRPVTHTRSLEKFSKKPIVYPTSGLEQFWILLKRTLKSTLRDQTLTHLRLSSHAVIGLLLGVICFDIGSDAAKLISNMGCIFIVVVFTMLSALMPTILIFPTEMKVFWKEHLNYWYSLKSFFLAKTMADLPFQIVFTISFVTTVYYMTGQPMETNRLFMFLTINILTAVVAQSIGLLIGAALDVETASYIGPITTLPVVLFAGFFINIKDIPKPLKWIPYGSYVKYGFEGAMLAIYGFDREKLESAQCDVTDCIVTSPKMLLEKMSMDDAWFWLDAAVLVALFVVIRIIAYFVLRCKLKLMQ